MDTINKIVELARARTRCGESAGVAVGDDIESLIDSVRYDEDPPTDDQDIFSLVEGELEGLRDHATAMLAEVKKLRGVK